MPSSLNPTIRHSELCLFSSSNEVYLIQKLLAIRAFAARRPPPDSLGIPPNPSAVQGQTCGRSEPPGIPLYKPPQCYGKGDNAQCHEAYPPAGYTLFEACPFPIQEPYLVFYIDTAQNRLGLYLRPRLSPLSRQPKIRQDDVGFIWADGRIAIRADAVSVASALGHFGGSTPEAFL